MRQRCKCESRPQDGLHSSDPRSWKRPRGVVQLVSGGMCARYGIVHVCFAQGVVRVLLQHRADVRPRTQDNHNDALLYAVNRVCFGMSCHPMCQACWMYSAAPELPQISSGTLQNQWSIAELLVHARADANLQSHKVVVLSLPAPLGVFGLDLINTTGDDRTEHCVREKERAYDRRAPESW